MENPSFEKTEAAYGDYNLFYWSHHTVDLNEEITGCETSMIEQKYLGNLCIVFNGSDNTQILKQTINKSGLSGDQLTIGGWAKGNFLKDELPIWVEDNLGKSEPINRYTPERKAFIRISFYNGGILQEFKDFDFNTEIVSWQYLRKSYKTQHDYDKIEFEVHYENPNMAYFDGFELYKDDYGTKYDYNGDGNVENIYTSEGVTKIYYESTDKHKTDYIITADGRRIDVDYNVNGYPELKTIENVKQSFVYDNDGNVIESTITNLNGDKWFSSSTTYDVTGQFINTVTDEFGNQIDYEYDIVTGLLEKIYSQDNVATDYEYDSFGRLIKVSKDNASTVYKYLDGRLDEIVIDNYYFYQFEYDDLDRIDKIFVGGSMLMDYEYDVFIKNPGEENNEITYYKDRIKKQLYANGSYIEFGYNELDQVEEIYFNGSTLPRFSYIYNESGNIKVYKDNRTGDAYTYKYDFNGRIKQVVDNYDNSITYEYDDYNRPDSYEYNINGANRKVVYTYYEDKNTFGLHKSSSYKDFEKKYIYDTNRLNRLEQVQLNIGTTNSINKYIAYDDTKVVNGNATYRVSKVVYTKGNYPSHETKYIYIYEYDARHNITSINVETSSGTIIDQYDYQYDNLNQLIREDVLITDDSSKTYTKYYYYDSRGNITDIKKYAYKQADTDVSVPSYYESGLGIKMYYNDIYQYNDIYHLDIGDPISLSFTYYDTFTRARIYGMTTTLKYSNLDTSTEGYYYQDYRATDGGFNRIDFRIVFKVGNPGPIEHLRYNYSNTWLDQLTGYDKIIDNGLRIIKGQEYSYDKQGNPTTIRKFNYKGTTYHHANLEYEGRQLTKITIYNSYSETEDNKVETISYVYNDQGIRIEKTIGSQTTRYVVDGDRVLVEDNGTDVIYYTYDLDGSLISMNLNDVEYFYITNQQGDIIELVDINGNPVVTYKYDAWGNIIYQTNNDIAKKNPYRYRGYRYDEEIGYYYLQSRYYNPEIGRFINADGLIGPVGGILTHNMYAYTLNNPVMLSDQTGYCAHATLTSWRRREGSCGGASFGKGPGYAANDVFPTGINSGRGTMMGKYDSSINSGTHPFTVGTDSTKEHSRSVAGNTKNTVTSTKGAGKAVHGNSKLSTKTQHGYQIYENRTGKVVKVGISGRSLNLNGTSPRANSQVNAWNKIAGYNQYGARVVESNIQGRQAALQWEYDYASYIRSLDHPMNRHRRP